MTDNINHPKHYQTASGLEAIDVIDAFFPTSFNLGNVFKYISRAGKKNNRLEDLRKARYYLDREIERAYCQGQRNACFGMQTHLARLLNRTTNKKENH